MAERHTRRVVIVGGGTAGWMTAAALGRFATPGWHVALVESDQIGTVGVGEATIPMIRNFNQALGIDEGTFLAATNGTYKLGIRFEGWGTLEEAYTHGFGLVGRGIGLIPFQHYWLRGRSEGFAGPLDDYVFNTVAARNNRFAHVERPQDSALPPVPYAYHFDATLYAGFLRTYAEARGVVRQEGRIVDVRRTGADGDVAGVILADGTSIAGDLFIDCSGFRSLLLGEKLGVPFVSWAHWLPTDRAVAVPSESTQPLAPYTRSIAEPAGWRWRIPLQHRTGNGHVFCSEFMGDDEATERLLAGLDGKALGDPRVLHFEAGRRAKMWERNVVAIGLSSGFIEPLESTSIHLVQTAINRLLEFLPNGQVRDADRDEFNRLAIWEVERIRDFIILHYNANGRVGEPFWDRLREMELPEELSRRIAMFRASGRVMREGMELFDVPGWVQVMIGQGIIPESWHPFADQLSVEQLIGFLETVRKAWSEDASRLPNHADYIARHCAAKDRHAA